MPNAVILVNDDRVRFQVEQYIKELGMDDLKYFIYPDTNEFEKAYFSKPPPEPERPATPVTETNVQSQTPGAANEPVPSAPAEGAATPSTASASDASPATAPSPAAAPSPAPPNPDGGDNPEEEKKEELFGEIHLVMFALDCIDTKSGAWIDRIKKKLKTWGLYPKLGPVRMVMFKYEDDHIAKSDLLHPNLDDLIFMPFDRLIFLQKLQIILALPKRASPSFLFNQEIQQEVEISKIVKMDKLSDVGLAIRNPVPLKTGVLGKFYLNFVNDPNRVEIYGKVIRSVPHPEFPEQYLVYFAFFAANKPELTSIRRALSKVGRYQSILRDNRERFRFNPKDVFADPEQQKMFGIGLIDTDEEFSRNTVDTMIKEMDRLEIVTESSFSVFVHKYLDTDANEDRSPPTHVEETEFYSNPVTISVSTTDLKCNGATPNPKEEDLFLGYPAAAVFTSPDRWLALIQDKESRLIVEESAQLILQGRSLNKVLCIHDSQGKKRAVRFKITKGEGDQLMNVEFSPTTLEEVMQYEVTERKKIKLNTMILDAAFVPEDPTGWCEGLRNRAVQLEAVKDPKELNFFIVGPPNHMCIPKWAHSADISGYFPRPIDNRQLLFALSELLGNKNTIYHFENLGWTSPNLNVHVAKTIKLEALSEFGARLRSSTPLAPSTVIYLRKSIYDKAPNACLAARVYSCEQDPNEKNSYQIFVTYFGIGDAFLKYARTWIRDNYAQAKQQGGGGGS